MRKFHRIASRRRLFIRGIAHRLIERGAIETTFTRAKEIRPIVERWVSIAKRQNLAARRLLLARMPKPLAEKLYQHIAPRYQQRPGGYLRIRKGAKTRKRDGVPTARIEFVE